MQIQISWLLQPTDLDLHCLLRRSKSCSAREGLSESSHSDKDLYHISTSFTVCNDSVTLRKHAYSTILKISPPKNENFQIKNSDIFHISAQNIDYWYSLKPPRRGGSNEYPHSMF